MKKSLFILLILIFILIPSISAQENTVLVPDIMGLNVPQAAAALNALGLRLGNETAIGWTEADTLPRDHVSAQSVGAGTSIVSGTAIDIEVLRSPNVLLVYDDNDLTLVNQSTGTSDVSRLRFTSTQGSSAAFAATRWSSNIGEGECLQIWSISRNESKNLPECTFIQSWLTTNNTGEHFWTQASGVQEFVVLEEGIERGRCAAAPAGSQDSPLRCEFYYSGAGAANVLTDYLYFAYTANAVAIINQSDDKWMPTGQTTLYNYNPGLSVQGAELIMGDAALFQNPDIVANITHLAPGQCIMLTINHPEGTNPPQPCTVIAQRDLAPSVAFWIAEFEVESAFDRKIRTCPAATGERLTLCVVPR